LIFFLIFLDCFNMDMLKIIFFNIFKNHLKKNIYHCSKYLQNNAPGWGFFFEVGLFWWVNQP
jgi:hypothetical protein